MTDTQTTPGVQLSDVAVEKVRSLLEAEGRDDLSLRIAVQPGGCSGLRYQLYFDDRSLDGDVVTDYNGVSVVTDKMSAPYLGGASIDFMDSIEKRASPSTTRTPRAPAPVEIPSTEAKPPNHTPPRSETVRRGGLFTLRWLKQCCPHDSARICG